MIWILSIAIIITIIKLMQWKHVHIGQFGQKRPFLIAFHEKVDVGRPFDTNKYIDELMSWNPNEYHQGNRNVHMRFILRRVIDQYYCSRKNVGNIKINDQVCVVCHKCFSEIDKLKKIIEKCFEKYTEELRKEHIKKKMAEDIYNEKCYEK